MSDNNGPGAPVRIWIDSDGKDRSFWNDTGDAIGTTEYVRADLLSRPSVVDEAQLVRVNQIRADLASYARPWYATDIEFLLSLLQPPVQSNRCGECGHTPNQYSLGEGMCYGWVKDPTGKTVGGICGHECIFPATGPTSEVDARAKAIDECSAELIIMRGLEWNDRLSAMTGVTEGGYVAKADAVAALEALKEKE